MRGLRALVGAMLVFGLCIAWAGPAAAAPIDPVLAKTLMAAMHAAPTYGTSGPIRAAGQYSIDAYEPDNATETAKPLPFGTVVHHTLWNPSLLGSIFALDVDVHSFDVVAGRTYSLRAWPTDGATALSSVLLMGGKLGALGGTSNEGTSVDASVTAQCWTAQTSGTVYAFLDLSSLYSGGIFFGSPTLGGSYDVRLDDLGVVPPGTVSRLDAPDRYAMAAELAKNGGGTYAGVTHVIVASGLDRAMPDALSASGLAGVLDAPVLLARGDRGYLPAPTAAALSAIASQNPGTPIQVHIIGGYGSIPKGLEKRIRSAAPGCTLERIAGADRYAVSANVARDMRAHEPTSAPALAFVVNGQYAGEQIFGLACSPVAASTHSPVLLVKGGSVPRPVAALLGDYGTRVLAGSAIPLSARLSASDVDLIETRSYSSGSRGAVCALIDLATARGWMGSGRYVLVGRLSDALTAGSSPVTRSRPMLFTMNPPDYLPFKGNTPDFLQERRASAPDVLIVGGPASVSPDDEVWIRSVIGEIVP